MQIYDEIIEKKHSNCIELTHNAALRKCRAMRTYRHLKSF